MFRNIEIENNILKNVGKEIVRNSAHAGLVVSHDLAIYLVQMKLLDPLKGYTLAKGMDRKVTQDLIDKCVKDLTEDSIWMNSIRMQVYWKSNAVDREEIKKDHHKMVFKKAIPILKEVMEAHPVNKEELEQLYKKIVLFTVVYSGLGNPTSQSVLREANPALHSVFKTTELESFIGLSRKEKEVQVMEFTRIVTGIRLFNKDCQKGGEGIDDLPVILVQAVQATKERINTTNEYLKGRINRLTTSLERGYRLEEVDGAREPEILLPSGFKKEQLEEMKRVLMIVRQHEFYIKRLRDEVEESSITVLRLVDRLQKTLLQLHEVVRYRAAIPTVQVYPLFIELSYIWSDLQDETAILSHINTVVVNVNALNKYADPSSLEIALSPSDSGLSDADRLLRTGGTMISLQDVLPHDIHIIPASKVVDLKALQFGGFCGWTISQTNGLIIPGNPNIGILEYKNKLYSFYKAEVAHKWMEDPDLYIFKVFSIARAKPELVKLLNLYEELEAVKSEELVQTEKESSVTHNAEVQTEIHPIESYICRGYTFSEWELKRRAIKLANLTKCLTKSQQTVSHSHYRANAGIQAEPHKAKCTQTRRDSSVNHPTISTYIYGIRGCGDGDGEVLTLTRPVKEGAISQKMSKSISCKK